MSALACTFSFAIFAFGIYLEALSAFPFSCILLWSGTNKRKIPLLCVIIKLFILMDVSEVK